MALFNKLFSSTKRKGLNSTSNGQSPNYLSNFPFDACQVRILLYCENDNRRRLLFDSLAVTQVNINDNHINNNNNNHSSKNVSGATISTTSINTIQTDVNNKRNKNTINTTVNGSRAPGSYFQLDDGMAYQHTRPTSKDITSIGEMVFGALAMSFRGTALKVHWLQSPPSKLLCSQVFLSPSSTSASIYTSCTGKSGGCANSLSPRHSIASDLDSDSLSMNSFSMPFSVHVKRNSTLAVDVPELSLDSTSSHNYPDSGFQDPWTTITSASSYQYSTRSSIGSILSDNDSFRKNSLDSSYMSSTFSSKSSDGSLQRRISRNLWTSFENRNSVSDFIGFIGDNSQSAPTGGSEGCVTSRYRQHIDTHETHSNPEMIRCRRPSIQKPVRREKLGLAVCITMSESFQEEMEQYCCEHMALFESMLCRLRAQVEQAYLRRKDFFQIMVKAWLSSSQWIVDFFTAPRLNFPVWLNITTSGNKYSKNVADKFMKELCWMLSYADTKDTNFFVSTMLTGILTYHLGWVTTVAAYNSKSKENAGAIATEQRAKLLEVSHKHPYNALWGQLGDLYGAIGNPPKLSRTIIYGQEKMMIEKLLYVMTYFIRCSEVRRATKREIFNKDEMNDLISQNSINNIKNEVFLSQKKTEPCRTDKPSGLKKSKTCSNSLKHLNLTEEELNEILDQFKIDEVISINKKNEIPNVLAFRDSRLVKQELRIGNYLMDTGIEKSSIINGRLELGKLKRRKVNKNSKSYGLIKLLVTTPENIELTVDSGDEAEEAVENGTNETDSGNKENKLPKHNFLWSLVPETVGEGVSLQNLSSVGRKDGSRPLKRMGKSQSFAELNGNREYQLEPENKQKTYISLSDLITANSMGNSQRMSWGIEPIKETVTLEEEKHFEMSQKRHAYMNDTNSESSAAGVVFVLGDNEALVNIKKSTESLIVEEGDEREDEDEKPTACTCPQKPTKKHSGVKFNFEEYPQIATNYMKNKNIDLTSYNFTSFSDFNKKSLDESEKAPEFTVPEVQTELTPSCEFCQKQPSSSGHLYQTPSNATELEFDTDDHCYVSTKVEGEKEDNNLSGVSLLKLPVPATKDTTEEEKTMGDMQVKAGYVPSLLVGVTDHYISDMVLQGTLDAPENWERKLKDDLMLSSHSASLNPTPTENVALIADMEEWDVKLICPQINHLPTHTSTTASTQPVGMSQLVSSMLETVYAMSSSGISAYEVGFPKTLFNSIVNLKCVSFFSA
ncbi:FNIP1 family protein [Megaselia abdita]